MSHLLLPQLFILLLKKFLTYFLSIGISALLIYWAFKGQDLEKTWEEIKNANFFWLGVSLVPLAISHWIRAARWSLVFDSIGYKASTKNGFIAVMTGYFWNFILPRAGEVARCSMLYKTDKIPVNVSLGTVLGERVIDLVMLLGITALAFLLEFDRLTRFFLDIIQPGQTTESGRSSYGNWMVLAVVVVLVLVAIAFAYRKRLLEIAIFQKLFGFLIGIWIGIFGILKLKNPGLYLVYTFVIWLGFFSSTYISLMAFESTSVLNLSAALMVFVAGSFGMVAPSQGGIGPFHFMISKVLASFYAIELTIGLSAATAMHASQMVFTILVGGICLALGASISKKQEVAA